MPCCGCPQMHLGSARLAAAARSFAVCGRLRGGVVDLAAFTLLGPETSPMFREALFSSRFGYGSSLRLSGPFCRSLDAAHHGPPLGLWQASCLILETVRGFSVTALPCHQAAGTVGTMRSRRLFVLRLWRKAMLKRGWFTDPVIAIGFALFVVGLYEVLGLLGAALVGGP